jgi:hypothetical protein
MSDLYRPQRVCQGHLCSFTDTRSGDGVDLPGFGRDRNDMSDQKDDAPAARNARCGSRPRAGRVPAREDDHGGNRQ